ncbi:MAG: Gfo/Idh/MocA family oxidoreductase [Acidobacteriia bacterium]|nr:Gfo/Idh/MocA family oxidoreductase [Terriglobia bacterium]
MNDQNWTRPPFRLAVVGCGAVTEACHLPAALKSSLVEVTALVDPALERAERLTRRFGLRSRVAARLEDVIDLADGVLIATPNHTHFDLARLVLERKLPVLVEKPLTTSYDQALELCRLAETNHTTLAVGFWTRFQPCVRLMKSLLQTGYLGAVRGFHCESGSRGGWSPVSAYNLDAKLAGGGILVVTGTHYLDRILDWFGEPEIVEFRDDSFGGPEANCFGRLRYQGASGPFEGSFLVSKTAGLKNRFFLETERYSCEVTETEPNDIIARPHDHPDLVLRLGSSCLPRAKNADYYQLQLEDFIASARSGKPPLVDGRSGAKSVKLVADLYAHRLQLEEPWMWYRRPGAEPCGLTGGA